MKLILEMFDKNYQLKVNRYSKMYLCHFFNISHENLKEYGFSLNICRSQLSKMYLSHFVFSSHENLKEYGFSLNICGSQLSKMYLSHFVFSSHENLKEYGFFSKYLWVSALQDVFIPFCF